MKAIFMVDGEVGLEVIQWIIEKFYEDVALVVTTSINEIFYLAKKFQINTLVFESDTQVFNLAKETELYFDIGFLLWWPKIIKLPLITLPQHGFINTHPSMLPHGRGKHHNFWALVEQSPYGVTLHFVNEGIDNGDIIAQQVIAYGWEDNGYSLYRKATTTMVELIKKEYPSVRNLDVSRKTQDLTNGSFHLAKELDEASHIQLEKTYLAKDLLNLLRARTFPGYPACWFDDGDEHYEVRIDIKRKKS